MKRKITVQLTRQQWDDISARVYETERIELDEASLDQDSERIRLVFEFKDDGKDPGSSQGDLVEVEYCATYQGYIFERLFP